MAISGSGGWIPSRGVFLKDGHLVWSGLCQNKPKYIVEQDMEAAADKLLGDPGKEVQVHFYANNAIRLAQIVRERQDGQQHI